MRSGEKIDSCEGTRGLGGLLGLRRGRGELGARLRVRRFGEEEGVLTVVGVVVVSVVEGVAAGELVVLESRRSFPLDELLRRGGMCFRRTMKTTTAARRHCLAASSRSKSGRLTVNRTTELR